MAETKLIFGEWLPDQPGVTGAITDAKNCYPVANGYAPFRSEADYSDAAAQDLLITFGGKFGGEVALFAAGATQVYKFDSSDASLDAATTTGYSTVESWFVGQTFEWLRTNVSRIKALISYSDPNAGHLGTVYQATNWIYQGNKIRWSDSWSFKWSEDDEWHHSRTSYVKYGTNDPKIIQTMVTSPFWIKREPRKHRYVYILML